MWHVYLPLRIWSQGNSEITNENGYVAQNSREENSGNFGKEKTLRHQHVWRWQHCLLPQTKANFLKLPLPSGCCEQQLSCVGDSHCSFCLVTEQFLVLKWYHSIATRTTNAQESFIWKRRMVIKRCTLVGNGAKSTNSSEVSLRAVWHGQQSQNGWRCVLTETWDRQHSSTEGNSPTINLLPTPRQRH